MPASAKTTVATYCRIHRLPHVDDCEMDLGYSEECVTARVRPSDLHTNNYAYSFFDNVTVEVTHAGATLRHTFIEINFTTCFVMGRLMPLDEALRANPESSVLSMFRSRAVTHVVCVETTMEGRPPRSYYEFTNGRDKMDVREAVPAS